MEKCQNKIIPATLYQAQKMDKYQLSHTFDAHDWAKEFVYQVNKKPEIATDVDVMTAWFANAIMAGYDEANRRISTEDKRR
jgi:hypothetical protein